MDDLMEKYFYSLKEAQVIIEQWRHLYHTRGPHSSLVYQQPARVTITQKPVTIENLQKRSRLVNLSQSLDQNIGQATANLD